MSEEQRFREAMQGDEIEVHPRTGEVLRLKPYEGQDEVCAICGKTTGGQHVTYTAADEGGFTACVDCHAPEA